MNTSKEDMKELIVKRLKEKTSCPIVCFDLVEEKTNIFDSKIGGAFYVSQGEKEPVNQNSGQPLYLLVQINFEQIPHIPSFPQKGLLQIFIAGDDDLYGADFDEPMKQKSYCIRFLKDIPSDVSEECIYNPKWTKETNLPFDEGTEYKLKGVLEKQAISVHDYQFSDTLVKFCRDLIPDDCQDIYDLDDETVDYLFEELITNGCQIGGYPCFTQWDPRETDYNDYDILLFQLDSIKNIMWGDCGVANFFIKKEDLENEDFSSILYNWDCC